MVVMILSTFLHSDNMNGYKSCYQSFIYFHFLPFFIFAKKIMSNKRQKCVLNVANADTKKCQECRFIVIDKRNIEYCCYCDKIVCQSCGLSSIRHCEYTCKSCFRNISNNAINGGIYRKQRILYDLLFLPKDIWFVVLEYTYCNRLECKDCHSNF